MDNKKQIFIGISVSLILVILLLVLVTGQNSLSRAKTGVRTEDDIASIYKGKSIRVLVPSEPGGGFDEYVRLLAPFIERYTGATVKVVNVPGAGGMRAINELYNSPGNGLTIAIMNGSAMVTNQLVGIKGAEYDIEAFEYLGRVVADTRVLTVSVQSGYESIDEIWHTGEGVKLGATGLGGSGYVDGVITKEALGLNVQVIHGFDSSSGIRQAMLRGNLAGAWGSWGSAKGAVESGLETILLQSGKRRIKDLPDTPTAFEFIDRTDNPERTREILTAWDALNSVGRPLGAPPGTAGDIVQYLRGTFDSIMHDPELIELSEASDRPLNYASGEEMLEIIRNATHMKAGIRQLFIRAVRGEL